MELGATDAEAGRITGAGALAAETAIDEEITGEEGTEECSAAR